VDLLSAFQVVAGLILLVAGGEGLVRGASGLALRVGLSPLVVGLTVVAFATSAPELAVSLDAVLAGEPDLAVGNVIGSNIANILLVLGVSALIAPLVVTAQVVRIDLPFMVVLTIALYLLARDGSIAGADGPALLLALLGYLVLAVVLGRRSARASRSRGESPAASLQPDALDGVSNAPPAPEPKGASRQGQDRGWRLFLDVVLVLAGVGLLVVGAGQLVDGATRIAEALGVSGLVIGLTVVAVGTSMPELATSIVAVRRNQRDLALGNVVGSNIFNIGLVLGLPATVTAASGGIPVPAAALALDLPVAIAAAIALLPVALSRRGMPRWKGGAFVVLYATYLTVVVLTATEHAALSRVTWVAMTFVVPLIALALVAPVVVDVHRDRQDRRGIRRSTA